MSSSNAFGVDIHVLGQGLTSLQKLSIKNALLKLQLLDNSLSNLKFWGKIQAQQNDYFIAVNTTLDTTVKKQFFFRSEHNPTNQPTNQSINQ